MKLKPDDFWEEYPKFGLEVLTMNPYSNLFKYETLIKHGNLEMCFIAFPYFHSCWKSRRLMAKLLKPIEVEKHLVPLKNRFLFCSNFPFLNNTFPMPESLFAIFDKHDLLLLSSVFEHKFPKFFNLLKTRQKLQFCVDLKIWMCIREVHKAWI